MSRKYFKNLLDIRDSRDYIEDMRKRRKDPRMARLKAYILSSGIRVEEVARKLGVTNRTIYNWMQGVGGISPLASGPLDAFLKDKPEDEARP